MRRSEPTFISSWQRISDDVTTSGRLTDTDLFALEQMGVRHVIDLAPVQHELALVDEDEKCAAAGIGHTLIEVPFNQPTEQLYQAFVAAYESAQRPVHVHCVYNYRTSAFLYRYHLEHGMSEFDARRIMQRHWSPDLSDHPTARPWRKFIEQCSAAYSMAEAS